MIRVLLLAALLSPEAWGHALVPMRLEADSGTRNVVAKFVLTNRFKFQDRFAIDCYKGISGWNKIDCTSIPESIVLSSNASKKVKVVMPVDSDGLYRICSIEDPAENEERQFITRLCAIVGVGVNPNASTSVRSKHRAAADAMAAGAGQNQVR